MNIPISKFPLGEEGRPEAGGWIRLAEADSAKPVNTPIAKLRYSRFAPSILRLWWGLLQGPAYFGIDLRVEVQPAALPSANLRRLRRHLLPKEGG